MSDPLSLFFPFWTSQMLLHSFRASLCLIIAKVSFAFMYFWAFNNISAIDPGGLSARAVTKSLDFNPALNVVSCTLSSASSTSKASLLNIFTYDLNDSPSSYLIASRWSAGLVCHWPPTKWLIKELLSCLKSSMVDRASLLNHNLAVPLRVVEKYLHKISSRVCYRLSFILKVIMWSRGSFKSLNDSSWGGEILTIRGIPGLSW